MKLKLFIALIIIIQCSCQNEQSPIEGSWLLVDNTPKPNAGFIPMQRGEIYHFSKDSIYISHVAIESVRSYSYELNDEYLTVDTMASMKIIHLSKDSMIIESDSSLYDMHLRPLKEQHFSKDEREELLHLCISNPWKTQSIIPNLNYTLYFEEENFEDKYWGDHLGENPWTRLMFYEEEYLEQTSSDCYPVWAIKEFKEKLLIIQTTREYTSFFQVLAFDEEKISGQNIEWHQLDWADAILHKVENVSPQEKLELTKQISGEWSMKELIYPSIEEINEELNMTKINSIGSIKDRVTTSDLKQQNLKFTIKENGSFNILAGDKVIHEGTQWDLSKDGRYLLIEPKLPGHEYIEIKKINNQSMTLRFPTEVRIPGTKKRSYIYTSLNFELTKTL